jgi:hypothetical protein
MLNLSDNAVTVDRLIDQQHHPQGVEDARRAKGDP